MGRATWVLAATTLVGFATSAYLVLDHGDAAPCEVPVPATTESSRSLPGSSATVRSPTLEAKCAALAVQRDTDDVAETAATRLERRAGVTREVGALLGRQRGETEDAYRARVGTLIRIGLAAPREHAAEMRKVAEAKARVTAEQSARLDQAFGKVYDEMLDVTNEAIADGQLSPYERDVSSWLQVAGGIGSVLGNAETQIAQILDPVQIRAMYDAGFDWSEYLGLHAPWEKFRSVPPAPSPSPK